MLQVLKDIVLFNHTWSWMFYACLFYVLVVLAEKMYIYMHSRRKDCKKCDFVEVCNVHDDASNCSLYRIRKNGDVK